MATETPITEEAYNALKSEVEQCRSLLLQKDEIINELRSQVDKYQSVLNVVNDTLNRGPANKDGTLIKPRTTRLLGISAEPESSLTFDELLKTRFTDYPKSDS